MKTTTYRIESRNKNASEQEPWSNHVTFDLKYDADKRIERYRPHYKAFDFRIVQIDTETTETVIE